MNQELNLMRAEFEKAAGCAPEDYDRIDGEYAISRTRCLWEGYQLAARAASTRMSAVAWMIWLHGPAGVFDNKDVAMLELKRRNELYPDSAGDRKLIELRGIAADHASRAAEQSGIYREELLQLAEQCGMKMTGKPDGSEPIEIVFSIDAWRKFDVATRSAQGEVLSRDQIRSIFMAHGFTIKEGQTDLKDYVYDAAIALLAAQCEKVKE